MVVMERGKKSVCFHERERGARAGGGETGREVFFNDYKINKKK